MVGFSKTIQGSSSGLAVSKTEREVAFRSLSLPIYIFFSLILQTTVNLKKSRQQRPDALSSFMYPRRKSVKASLQITLVRGLWDGYFLKQRCLCPPC